MASSCSSSAKLGAKHWLAPSLTRNCIRNETSSLLCSRAGRRRWISISNKVIEQQTCYLMTGVRQVPSQLHSLHRFSESRPKHQVQKLASVSTSFFGKEYDEKPWHDPSFMDTCSPETVEQWLISLLKSTKGSDDSSHHNFSDENGVDSTAYLRVLQAYARSKIGGAPQKAEYWIGQLERNYAEAAKSLLSVSSSEQLVSSEMQSESVGTTANVPESPFAKFIASKSKTSQDNNNLKKTRLPTNKMDDKSAASIVQNLQPTVQCYNAVIEAWGNDTDTISVIRARRWLTKLEEGTIDSPFPPDHPLHYKLEPNSESYDLYLHCCSRGIGRDRKLCKKRAEEAEQLLRFRMSDDAPLSIRPTTESFNYVLRAWTRCRKEMSVADKVMSLVRHMEGIQRDYLSGQCNQGDSWKRNISPNTKTYTMAIDAWVVVAGLKANRWHSEQLALDNTYRQIETNQRHEVLENKERFLARRNKYGDGSEEMENASAILQYIQTLEDLGRQDVNATVVGYNTILSGWAKLASTMRPEIPLKSEAILHEMMEKCEDGSEDAAPNVTSFNAVIKAWGATKRSNSGSRCEWWLRKMIKESSNTKQQHGSVLIPRPNVNTYNMVMEAFLQIGDPAKVQDLMLEMDDSEFVSPNSESFSKVIRAWLHDEMNKKQQHGLSGLSCENAWRWLKELLHREKMGVQDLGSAPDLFSSILKTAARTESKGENLLTIGQGTFWALRESRFGINAEAYIWLLEIGLKVLSSPANVRRREEFIMSLIEQCCKDGLLSAKFTKMVRMLEEEERLATDEGEEEVFYKYLEKPPFPATWNRNISDGTSV